MTEGGEGGGSTSRDDAAWIDSSTASERPDFDLSIPRELPLFPLNVVLFPGMPLPLHVFEPRYHALVKRCLMENRVFGVTLISSGPEVGGLAEVQEVGTTAYIERVEKLADGRLALATRGVQRFRIIARLGDDPYPRAVVEEFEEEDSADEELVREVQDLLLQYLKLLSRREGLDWGDLSMPSDAVVLGYVVAAILPCSLEVKQQILQEASTAARLTREAPMLRNELERSADQPSRARRARPFRPTLNLSAN